MNYNPIAHALCSLAPRSSSYADLVVPVGGQDEHRALRHLDVDDDRVRKQWMALQVRVSHVHQREVVIRA